MRREDKEFDPFAETPVDGVIAAQCAVQVIFKKLCFLILKIFLLFRLLLDNFCRIKKLGHTLRLTCMDCLRTPSGTLRHELKYSF